MVHRLPAALLAVQLALAATLAAAVGLTGWGWVAVLAYGVGLSVLLERGRAAHGVVRLGPADRVTLLRAVLVGGVTALVADPDMPPGARTTLVALAAVAMVLDGVDGRVARRTGTASRFGARFDEEVDAFLILVLSVDVARSAGAWVLAIGAARYAYAAAGRVLLWLRGPLPARYWGKVVAVVQGVVLTVAASAVLPAPVTDLLLAGALGVLAESFGHSVRWRWRHRHAGADPRSLVHRERRAGDAAPHGLRASTSAAD